jgi:glyceraldehyde-3-phosphate dehydrogenase (NADP+)
LLQGTILEDHEEASVMSDVMGCCSADYTPQLIGKIPQMSTEMVYKVLQDAKDAWKGGSGEWPQMSLAERIQAIEIFLEELTHKREAIVTTLMWEIGKNRKDAEAEFDRTIQFCKQVIETAKNDSEFAAASWQSIGSTKAFMRRAAIGVILCLGPMNYPLNETYATLIPALLMGNVAIMKIPTVGGLSHLLTMEAFVNALPPGAMNFVSGGGRATMPPLMKTGDIDGLAFIGGSKAADDLIGQHPHPHRLKIFLQLEAKNMGVSIDAFS